MTARAAGSTNRSRGEWRDVLVSRAGSVAQHRLEVRVDRFGRALGERLQRQRSDEDALVDGFEKPREACPRGFDGERDDLPAPRQL